jgi:hypothetical protein
MRISYMQALHVLIAGSDLKPRDSYAFCRLSCNGYLLFAHYSLEDVESPQGCRHVALVPEDSECGPWLACAGRGASRPGCGRVVDQVRYGLRTGLARFSI